jgi:dTDP-4-amino-4,6-dideoxygalactose transaminase
VTDVRFPIVRTTVPAFDDIATDFRAVLASGQLTTGARTRSLEDRVATLLGVAHVVAVSSCTTGLALTLRALDLEGEILVPSYAFSSAGGAAVWAGLTPVFCDCRRDTLTLDVDSARAAIGPRTRAVMPVSTYGMPPDIEEIEALARTHGLKVVYDSAMGLGSRYRGCYLGGFGDAEVFSLSTRKLVTGVEGGLVTTNDAALAQRLCRMRDYGRREDRLDFVDLGLSARFSEFHAVVAERNLAQLEEVKAARAAHVRRFGAALAGVPGLAFFRDPPDRESGNLLMLLGVDPVAAGCTRDEVMQELERHGIETSRYWYPPLHRQAALSGRPHRCAPSLEATEQAADRWFAVPLYDRMSHAEIDEIAAALHAAIPAAASVTGRSAS